MVTFYVIVVILVSVILGLIVLVQNPKGGGLAGNIAGFSNQFMGVKQTTDVLEKGTWIFAGALGLLCLVSSFFISKSSTNVSNRLQDINGSAPISNPQPSNNTLQLPAGQNTSGPDSN
ncbi:MAG: preprotein translocase subunit SecG [Bacteroidia bacterium]|nr:preprotein translocase subunit SecG [Bacteroidia bacterium]